MKYDFTSIMDRMERMQLLRRYWDKNPVAPKPPKEGFDVIRCGLQI